MNCVSPGRADQFVASPERAPQCRGRLRRIDDGVGESALILGGQLNDARLFDTPFRRLLRGGDDEFRRRAPLEFRRSLQRRATTVPPPCAGLR
jgi:hypothetical protein